MEYEIGKTYQMSSRGLIVGSDGGTYLNVQDAEGNYFTVKPYQCHKDWGEIPTTISCYLRSIVLNRPRFEISRDSILDYWYANYIGHHNDFVLKSKGTDSNTGKVFYNVTDPYGFEQRFYPHDAEFELHHNIGEEVKLVVESIHHSEEGKNNAFLELSIPHEDIQVTEADEPEMQKRIISNEDKEKVENPIEDVHTEFKSSIAFLSNGKGADVQEQLGILMRTIAGFMNKDGGTLYIGVNDAGEPYRDISEDYGFLNDDDTDNYEYKKNFDHYKLKILNTIKYKLGGSFSTSLVRIEKKLGNGVNYAIVTVEKSAYPIWYDKEELFVRCDCSTRRLLGDDITKFIQSRQGVPPQNVVVSTTEDNAPTQVGVTVDVKPIAPLSQKNTSNAWRYISFFNNGDWEFRKDESDTHDCIMNVPVPQYPRSFNIVLGYEDGHVNVVELKSLLYGTGANANTLIPINMRRKNALSKKCGLLVSAFCCKKKDSILIENSKDDVTYLKAHKLEDVSSRDSFNAAGGQLVVPNGSKLIELLPLTDKSSSLVAVEQMGLMAIGAQKYYKNGVPKDKLDGRYLQVISNIQQVN